MTLTAQDAINLLSTNPSAYGTIDSLKALASQVSVDAFDDITVFYSGNLSNVVKTSSLIGAMVSNGENIRIIDKSPVSVFLKPDVFLDAVGKIYGVTLTDMKNENFLHPAKDWLFDAINGPWADASKRFAEASV